MTFAVRLKAPHVREPLSTEPLPQTREDFAKAIAGLPHLEEVLSSVRDRLYGESQLAGTDPLADHVADFACDLSAEETSELALQSFVSGFVAACDVFGPEIFFEHDELTRGQLLLLRARRMRRYPTAGERRLGEAINEISRGQRFEFLHQMPIGGRYIVDFLCYEIPLVIEVDGLSHIGKEYYDQERLGWLESQGYRVLYFTNHQVETDIEWVKAAILAAIPDELRRGTLP